MAIKSFNISMKWIVIASILVAALVIAQFYGKFLTSAISRSVSNNGTTATTTLTGQIDTTSLSAQQHTLRYKARMITGQTFETTTTFNVTENVSRRDTNLPTPTPGNNYGLPFAPTPLPTATPMLASCIPN